MRNLSPCGLGMCAVNWDGINLWGTEDSYCGLCYDTVYTGIWVYMCQRNKLCHTKRFRSGGVASEKKKKKSVTNLPD
jgi:hypothetical protein